MIPKDESSWTLVLLGKSKGQKWQEKEEEEEEKRSLQVPGSYATKSRGVVKIGGNHCVELRMEFLAPSSLSPLGWSWTCSLEKGTWGRCSSKALKEVVGVVRGVTSALGFNLRVVKPGGAAAAE